MVMPGRVVFPAPPPLTDVQKHALAVYITRKRAVYEKKDAIQSRKYKWLQDHNQQDPDLVGVEITEESLEELKKKRQSLSEEKHKLFEQLKSLLPATEEEEPVEQTALLTTTPTPFYPGGVPPPVPFGIKTEPITPRKPSEMSPVRNPLDTTPIYPRPWERVGRPSYPATREERMDHFTKAFEHTLSKARMSEMSSVSEPPPVPVEAKPPPEPAATDVVKIEPAKIEPTPKKSEPLKPTPKKAEPLKPEIKQPVKPPTVVCVRKPAVKPEPPRYERKWSQDSDTYQRPILNRKPDLDTKLTPEPEVKKSVDPLKGVEISPVKSEKRSEHGGRSKKSLSGIDSISSSSKPGPAEAATLHHHQRQSSKDSDSDLPPVIKISKAEIHSKVMSWPTSQTSVPKKTSGEKDKKGDPSGSSLLEFAFQSALFGNTCSLEGAAANTAAASGAKTPPEPAPTTTASSSSDLLAALSLSYGGGKADPTREEETKTRKRGRSPDIRSPSPELVQVYKPEQPAAVKPEKRVTPPPPPPPPPPPKTNKKVLASPVASSSANAMSYGSNSPSSVAGSVPYSFHSPMSFLSPTHPSQFAGSLPMMAHTSPLHSPMLSPYGPGAVYPPPPHSPRLPGMLPPHAQPPPGMPPLPPPPSHLLSKNRGYPGNRYL